VKGMVHFTATIIALAGVLILGLRPVSSAPAPEATPAADLRRAAVVLAYFDALSRGDASAAAAAFAEDGFMIGAALKGLCSLATPCHNRDEIGKNMELLVKTPHLCETPTSLQVVGSFVIGRLEVRNDELRGRGIERLLQSFLAQVMQDKIIAYFGRSDLADPETARNAAIVAGTQPKGVPINVVPPCR